jgi:hypothetical protein
MRSDPMANKDGGREVESFDQGAEISRKNLRCIAAARLVRCARATPVVADRAVLAGQRSDLAFPHLVRQRTGRSEHDGWSFAEVLVIEVYSLRDFTKRHVRPRSRKMQKEQSCGLLSRCLEFPHEFDQ